jgi:peptide/nickel transport system substrate-binding protein
MEEGDVNAHQWTLAHRRPSRRQLLQGSAGLAAGSAAFLIACGGSDEKKETAQATTAPAGGAQPTTAAAAATPAPKRGGKYMDFFTAAPTFNPITSFQEGWILAGANVYDKLVTQRMGKDTAKESVLEAAQSVEQPDPTTIIFKLKPGLKYQDKAPVNGRAVDAEDIIKWNQYVRDEPRAVNNSFQVASMQSMEAPDAQTVTFKLRGPNAYVFSGTQLCEPSNSCIIPREVQADIEKAAPIGSGPYYLAEFDQDVRYLYKRNDGYRDAGKGLPYIDEREYRKIVDPAAQEAAFRSEQTMVYTAPFVNIGEQIKRDMSARVETTEYLSLSMNTFSANVNRPPWNDVRVREAVYRFMNRQQYVDLLDGGKGAVPPGPLSVGWEEYQLDPKQTEKYFTQDARAAKQLLDAAGFPYNQEVEMITIIGARNQQAVEIFQQQASQVGMKVRIQALSVPDFLQDRVRVGNWETWIAAHPSYDTPQVALRLQHTKTNNQHQFNGLRDPQVDAMIDKSEQTVDRQERIKLIKDIQIALLEKYTPFVFLQNATTYFHRYKYLRDYEFSPVGTVHTLYRTNLWIDK